MAAPADAPTFVRAGLLSVGQGVWGTMTPAETIGLLKRADVRRLLINPAYAAEIQRSPESVPAWRRQVVDWLLEVRLLAFRGAARLRFSTRGVSFALAAVASSIRLAPAGLEPGSWARHMRVHV